MKIKIKRVKQLKFRRPDNEIVPLIIPPKLNQNDISAPKRTDYFVFTRSMPEDIPQAAILPLMIGNNVAGFLIPGQTILYNGGIEPAKLNSFFGTYNLLIAMDVCEKSWSGNYTLASSKHYSAECLEDIFQENVYYGIIERKKIGAKDNYIPDDYLLSFISNNLFERTRKRPALAFGDFNPTKSGKLALVKNKPLPTHFRTLFDTLIPHTEDAALRFFYVYQAIEILMASHLDSKYDDIRTELISTQEISKVKLRNLIDKLNDSTKEKARINEVLGKADPTLDAFLNDFLRTVGEDPEILSFADKVYRVRNIFFHDYTRVHLVSDKIGDFATELAIYLLKRFQYE